MGDFALFYNSKGGDRRYSADDFSEWLKQFFTDGIVNGGLYVKANNDMTVTVADGVALIGGKVKNFNLKKTLSLATASGSLNRIDNIVVRRDDNARDFVIDVVKGVPAEKPAAPAPTRNGAVYELVLAQVYIEKGTAHFTQSSVKDTRMQRSVCGWVQGTTEHIQAEELLAQIEAAWSEWFNYMKGQLTTDAAGSLQTQLDTLKAKISYGTKLPPTGKEGDIFILVEA